MQTNITVEDKISKENKCIQTIYIYLKCNRSYVYKIRRSQTSCITNEKWWNEHAYKFKEIKTDTNVEKQT